MKRVLMIFCVGLITTFVLVSLSPTAPSKAQRNQNSSLDEQAFAQASRFFGRMYAKCGEYYYYSYTLSFGEAFLYQCKYAPSTSAKGRTLQPRQLSEADRLNGVDPLPVAWDGSAIINLGLCRHQVYRQQTGPGYSAWGEWSDRNDEFLPLTKKKGRWEFLNKLQARGGEKVIVPVTCDDIPSQSKRAPVKSPYWDGNLLKIPATFNGWFSLGRGPMRVRLPGGTYSQIIIDGSNSPRTPQGGASAPSDALAPGLKLGAIIIRIGNNGKPFEAFGGGTINLLDGIQIDSSEEIFIAINDSNFGDNKGEHVVRILGQDRSSLNEAPRLKRNSAENTSENFGLKLDHYCKSKFGDSAVEVATEGDAFSWRCMVEDSYRRKKYFDMNMDEACRMQHGANFKAKVDNPQDHRSWSCIR